MKITELSDKISSYAALDRLLVFAKQTCYFCQILGLILNLGFDIEISMQQVGSDVEQELYAMVNTDTGKIEEAFSFTAR
ncbi:MAG: hypothetical protein ACR5K7_05725 [Symbiopectobacterium sp.]